MRKLLAYLGIGMMVVALPGCYEDVDVFEPAELTSGDISRFFGAVKSDPLYFDLDVSKEEVLVLPGAGQVIVPPASLTTLDGSPVSGKARAIILPIHQKGGFVRNNVVTAADGRLIESAGMLFFEFRQNGQELRLAEGASIRVQLYTSSYQPALQLFAGQRGDTGKLDWAVVAPAEEHAVRPADFTDAASGQRKNGFEVTLPKPGWIHCARFLEMPAGDTGLCIRLPQGFSQENTAVFLSLQNANAVANLHQQDNENPQKFCQEGLPAGYKTALIVITEGEDGDYFFAQRQLILTENMTVNIVPERATLPDILLALERL